MKSVVTLRVHIEVINMVKFTEEIYIDCWESCINCSSRFWALENPVIFCVWCDMLGVNQ